MDFQVIDLACFLNLIYQFLSCTENVDIENALAVARAIDWYGQDEDFADAFHLASCGASVMHTFDRCFFAKQHARLVLRLQCMYGKFEIS
jgi:hypothetical protein